MLRLRSSLPTLALLCTVASCARVGGSGEPAAAPAPGPTLAPGRVSATAETEASGLLAAARSALAAGRLDDARSAAARVVDELPASRVAVDALLVLAQVEAAAGDVTRATAHAERLARVLPPDDPRQPEAATVRARALVATGRGADAVRVLLSLPPEVTPVGGDADQLVRDAIEDLDRDALGGILQDTPLGNPLSVPVLLAYAGRLRLAGEGEAAGRYASAALEAGAAGEDAVRAEAILEGRALPGEAPGRVVVLLPLSGSPALQNLSRGIQEGAEAALAASSLDGTVELEVLDDRGDPAVAADLVRAAVARGVEGIIGPLQDDVLRAAATARGGGVPLVSPTAYEVPAGATSVFSLSTVDPGAPLALADWAASVGLRQVVVLQPTSGPSAEEARIFADAFQAAGGSVLRTLTYAPGATFFQDQMRAIQGLRPEGLVLPIPVEDVPAIASQAAFYALDTLGIQLMGTAAWGDPAVLGEVNPRYTNGVVTSTAGSVGDAVGFRTFVAAYERRFQRTLVDAAFPALGFDAASLLLRALESGARGPASVAGALEEIEGFAGATGTLSVRDGRVVREHVVRCLEEGRLVALPEGERPVPVFRAYPPDPETGIVPEGPGRPAGFRCSDVPDIR